MWLFLTVALTVYIAMMTTILISRPTVVFTTAGGIRDFGIDTDRSRSVLSLHVLAPLSSILATAIGASCVML